MLFGATRLLGRGRTWALVTLAILSLLLSGLASSSWPTLSFYLPLTRAWELLGGVLLALNIVPPISRRAPRELIAAASLAAIVASFFLLSDREPFPGWIALVPVVGAAGLLYAAPETRVGKLLRSPDLVGAGLVSYSLYLWHWPLLVFWSYWLVRPLDSFGELRSRGLRSPAVRRELALR